MVTLAGQRSRKLEKRLWYRLAKVTYVFAYLPVAAMALFIVYDDKRPRTRYDEDKTLIICNNGKAYSAGRNNIYLSAGVVTRTQDEDARKLCEYDIIQDYSARHPVPKEKNYRVQWAEVREGGWGQVFMYAAISLLVIHIVFETIKRTFLYVAVGRKFFDFQEAAEEERMRNRVRQ